MSHSMADLVNAGRMTEAERRYEPKEPGRLGSKKDVHGLLPLEHPIIEKLSDPGHFVKSYKSEQYVFVSAPKKTSLTCKADAMRLSRNMSYMLKQYRRGTENCSFEKFQRAAKASFEHHWNNHQFCGTWCQAKDWTDEEKETNKNMFRNKETHQKEYYQQFGVHSKYTEEDRLRRVFHEWTTNKTEQIHSLVTNVFLPKRSYYCRTICGRARTYLAVSIDSIGYYEYNRRLYLELGLQMTTITAVFYKQQDKRRQTDRAYANKPERRKLRAEHRLENINEEWRREVIDKQTGNTYRSGIAVTSQTTKSSLEKQSSSQGGPVVDGAGGFEDENNRPFCKACKNYGHQRRSSRLCPKNPKGNHYEGKTMRFYVLVTRLRNCRLLCNQIERACTSVLIYRTLSTKRESCRDGYEHWN